MCGRWRRYYLNGNDAYRLKLLLPLSPQQERHHRQLEQEALEEDEDAAWVAEQIQRLGVGGSRVQEAEQPPSLPPQQQQQQQQLEEQQQEEGRRENGRVS